MEWLALWKDYFPITSLIFFFVVYSAMLWYVFTDRREKRREYIADLPLSDSNIPVDSATGEQDHG